MNMLIDVPSKNIKGCLRCTSCQRNGGTCVQKDDMTELYGLILAADAIVIASPVYFYSWTSQIKALLDRTCALLHTLRGKKIFCNAREFGSDAGISVILKARTFFILRNRHHQMTFTES